MSSAQYTDDPHQKDIRDRYELGRAEWNPIRAHGHQCMRALTPKGTWSEADLRARQAAGRPCLHLDELTQHVNQLINDVRAAKRAIEVNPEGYQTNEAKARFYGDHIRQIEYRSNAVKGAYITGFENAVQRSFGFWRLTSRYTRQTIREKPTFRDFEQELRIEAVDNPDIITPEPYWKDSTMRGLEYLFIEENYSHADFRERWPRAQIQHFTGEHFSAAGEKWVDSERITIMEYWCLKTRPKDLVLIANPTAQDPQGQREPLAFWRDSMNEEQWGALKASQRILRTRQVDHPYVMRELTNGLETLEDPTEWPGEAIPFVGCFGKVLYTNDGGKSKRELQSLITMALHPQQMYNYYGTSEAEMVGQTPKFPYFAYKGQLDQKTKELIAKSLHEPVAVIEVNPVVDQARQVLLPFPQRNPYDPPIQAFSVGREESRRAVQAATGAGFLPTQAQRLNEKSGRALDKIALAAQKGAYHFIDHYEASLQFTGELLQMAIPHFYDTARDLHVRKPDDTPVRVRINDPSAPPNEEYEENIMLSPDDRGDVTISVGPSFDDERDKASDYADVLTQAHPELFRIFAPLILKLKNLGPIGDEMIKLAELMQPPEFRQSKEGQPDPAMLMAQLQQGKQMLDQAMAHIAELEKEREGETVKAQGQVVLAQVKGEIDKALKVLDGKIKLSLQNDDQAHEMALAGAEAAHAREQAERQADDQRRLGRQSAALSGGRGASKPH